MSDKDETLEMPADCKAYAQTCGIVDYKQAWRQHCKYKHERGYRVTNESWGRFCNLIRDRLEAERKAAEAQQPKREHPTAKSARWEREAADRMEALDHLGRINACLGKLP